MFVILNVVCVAYHSSYIQHLSSTWIVASLLLNHCLLNYSTNNSWTHLICSSWCAYFEQSHLGSVLFVNYSGT